MSSIPAEASSNPVIPPLAGLATYEEASRVGYSVDENVERMRRYNYVKKRLYEMSAAFMNPTPEWEVKSAFSLHMWLDAKHSQALRERVAELRRPPLHLDNVPDERLEALMEEAFCAEGTLELLVGIFRVIRPALLAAYREHLTQTNPVFDHPTCRLLRIAAQEEEQMIGWGEQAIAALLARTVDDESHAAADAWDTHLRAYLQVADGIGGSGESPENLSLPPARANAPFIPSFDPKRDARSGDIYNFSYRPGNVYTDETADADERTLALMFKRLHEMDVPEMMASIILETKDKPWEYYREMSRQLWDEARHALMGEVWFAARGIDVSRYPNHVGWCLSLNLDRTPLERHVVLLGIEQGLMDGKMGKRYEWNIAQEAGDALAAYLQDYDWADEVLHARIGRRWLKPEVGSVKEILALAQEISRRPKPSMDERARTTPQENWWPQFVREALGKESTAASGKDPGPAPPMAAASG